MMGLVERFREQAIPKVTAFSAEDYAERVARARAAMATDGLDFILVQNMASVCYLTGYETPMSDWSVCLLLPLSGDPTLYACDVGLALTHTHLENIEWIRWDTMGSSASQLVEALNAAGADGKRIGLEMRRPGLNAHTYREFERNFSRAKFIDADDILLRLRLIKSPAEIANLKIAARYTDAGMWAAISNARAGATENDLAAAATSAMISAGSEFFSIDPHIRTGARTSMAHATYRRNELRCGDAIILEMGGVHHRYTAPLYRTAVVGSPSQRLSRLADLCLEALACLYEHIRPGRSFGDAAAAAQKVLSFAEPDAEVVPSHGYSVGLGFPPDWVEHSAFIRSGSDTIFQPGMTFHTPRSLRVPGVMSAGFSETVLVTEHGCEPLSKLPRVLSEV